MKEMYRGAVEVENREYHRTHFNLNTRFAVVQKGELPKPIQSLVADVGAGGMAMHTPQPLVVGQLLTVNLYLPPLEAYENAPEMLPTFCEEDCEPVTILARVVWNTPLPDKGYKVGLKFFDVDRKNRKRLKHFLVEYELDEKITP